MRTYTTAQNTGLRTTQCDATAVHTAPDGTRAYVLLDGIGSTEEVREWTRTAARRLARAASRRADSEAGLRHIYDSYAAEPNRQDPYMWRYMPSAAAVVAVLAPDQRLKVAWAGDCRAYLLVRGITRRLTEDHNMRRVLPPTPRFPSGGSRNEITSYLGSGRTDDETMSRYGHPAIEAVTIQLDGPCRLLLASDGAYEPHQDAGHDLFAEVDEDLSTGIALRFVDAAIETAVRASLAEGPHPYADNATVLLADIG
ncbi:hypothetical protein GCM10010387_15920 [Streptomyces inusitatus]|uniref:PPM-type phosphatase domain-containing protein n=1 Tax=Streptomyces inusitatus TaxID=68221 RepID=A0A918PUU2_9ACTN|nr:protein phosphatase 2C domain-containing protein [Streptomyces inusitatus]GGZ23538.1 hypothetical protein GCM10010387_15920 [Streptomyces inusitatus]